MKNQRKFFIVSLIFLCLLVSLSAVSADDMDTIADGEVSGDVDVAVTNPWTTSGELSYEIPEDVENVDYAGLYVNVYSGSASSNYGAESNISITSNGGTEQIASEQLVCSDGTTDGTVYTINNHTTKCYSDYHMIYNITDKVQGKTGTITFNVINSKIDGYDFDGKIKLIGLVFAYNDGDNDKVSYWVNTGQSWTKESKSTNFNVGTIENKIAEATIDNVALSSGDGLYTFNDNELDGAIEHVSGNYYQYNKFDVADKLVNGSNTLVYAYAGASQWGSFKNVLSVLKVKSNIISVNPTLSTEYTNAGGACYAGTNNTLKLNLSNNGNVNAVYAVDFYVDGVKVGSYELEVPVGENGVLYMTDDTIRPVTENTVIGADNAKVNYTAIISDKATGEVLNETGVLVPVLYNGNLGKDLAYPAENMTSFNNISVNGGVIIDTKEAATYLAGGNLSRTDIWALDLAADADVINAYLYVAYNWDKTNGNLPVWTTTFNNVVISPVASYRDQGNLGTYGRYGYGLVVYDVSDLVNKNGGNTFVLNKESGMTAVYPSTFVVFYNVTDSDTITTVYMYNGADLLSNSNNLAGRIAAANSVLDVRLANHLSDAKLYVFAAGAQAGEGNLIVNGVSYNDVWTGTSNTTDEYIVDLTGSLASSNDVSFVATGSTILALQQFVVLKNDAIPSVSAKVASEYTSGGGACYAGTNNTLQVNLTNDGVIDSTYVVDLYVNGEKLDSTEVTVAAGEKTIVYLTDDTIRPITEATVNGAENAEKVNYTVIVSEKLSGAVLSESTLLPTVWYNGNLGKDFAYPAENITPFNIISVNGDIIIDTKADSTYLTGGNLSRTDVWTLKLPTDAIVVNGYLYVAYNWDKTNGNLPVWTTTFNNVTISPVASYRDQSNLGTFGRYGYGLVVYDVSDLVNKNGDNTFVLNKESGMTAVYPSTFVVFYNVTDSDTITTVYMYNGADLLSNSNNLAGRTAAANSVLDVSLADNLLDAKLHVFAASAQAGEGNLIVNGVAYNDVWTGTSNSADEYVVDLTGSLASSNDVSFVATGSTILALQQFVVVKNAYAKATSIVASALTTVAKTNKNLVITLKDASGALLKNTKVTVFVNGKTSTVTTNSYGKATIKTYFTKAGTYYYSLWFAGSTAYKSTFKTVKVTVSKQATKASFAAKTFKRTAKKPVTFTLRDASGKVLAGKKITFTVNKKTYTAKTNSKGIAKVYLKISKKGKYLAIAKFAGDATYKAISKKAYMTIK